MEVVRDNQQYIPPVFTENVKNDGKNIDWLNKFPNTGVEIHLEYRTDPNTLMAHIFVFRQDAEGVVDEQQVFEPTTEGTLNAFDTFVSLSNKQEEKENPAAPPPPPPSLSDDSEPLPIDKASGEEEGEGSGDGQGSDDKEGEDEGSGSGQGSGDKEGEEEGEIDYSGNKEGDGGVSVAPTISKKDVSISII